MASYLERRLAALGAECHMDGAGETFAGDCGNLVARLDGTVDAPPILLGAHMDTVAPTRGLTVVQAKGRFSSDGTTILGADDRAGITIILGVLSALVEERRPHGPLEVVFTVSEERGMHGAKALDIEPSPRAWASCSTARRRPASSSSRPREPSPSGSSSTGWPRMPPWRRRRASMPSRSPHARSRACRSAAWTTPAMLNVGSVHGGGAINVVPDTVEITGETRSADPIALRAPDRPRARRVRAERGRGRRFGGDLPHAQVRRIPPAARPSRSCAPPRGVSRLRGSRRGLLGYPGGSDANVLNQRGLPTVNLGIGTQDAHSPHEAIADSLADAGSGDWREHRAGGGSQHTRRRSRYGGVSPRQPRLYCWRKLL